MKASELRIGNLVNDYQFKKPLKVTIGVLEEIENGMDFYEPIPLTEEWFLKLGFNYHMPFDDEDSDFYVFQIKTTKGENISFAHVSDEIGWATDRLMITIEIHYVHQLQNLYFAITGEELAIE